MNQKLRKIIYKIYLSAQGLILVVGVGILLWSIVAAIHDLRIASKGKQCVEATLGSKALEWRDTNLGPERWDSSVEIYAKGLDHPSKKYALKELLERKCSEYLRVSIYESDGTVGIYTNNYLDGYPASASERAGYIGLTIGITTALMAALFGLKKWLSWLLKD